LAIVAAAPDAISEAATLLRAGHLVAFPTETVYGLGADATNGHAVASIFATKGRPQFNPLIVHVADVSVAERLAYFTDGARRIAQAFWPGPVTLVLKRRPESPLSDLVSAGLDSVASGGRIVMRSGSSSEAGVFEHPSILDSFGGSAVVGAP